MKNYTAEYDVTTWRYGGLWPQPPALDARTAYQISAFLHHLTVGLHRLNVLGEVGSDPFMCFADVWDSLETSHEVLLEHVLYKTENLPCSK